MVLMFLVIFFPCVCEAEETLMMGIYELSSNFEVEVAAWRNRIKGFWVYAKVVVNEWV